MPRQTFLNAAFSPIAVLTALIAWPSNALTADSTKYLPDKTMLVVSINLKQILQSQFARAGDGPLRPIVTEAGKMLERVGLDAGKDIDRIWIAIGDQMNAKTSLVIIDGRFDAAKIHAGLKDLATKRNIEFRVFEEGGVTIFQGNTARPANSRQLVGLPEKFYFAALDPSTIAIAADPSSMRDAIALKVGSRRSMVRPKIVELVSKMGQSDSVSLVFAPPDGMLTSASTVGLQTVVGSIVVTDAIVTDVLVGARDADVAKRLFDEISEGHQRLKDILPGLATEQPGVGRREQEFIRNALNTIRVAIVPNGVQITSTIPKTLIDTVRRPPR